MQSEWNVRLEAMLEPIGGPRENDIHLFHVSASEEDALCGGDADRSDQKCAADCLEKRRDEILD